MKKDLIMNKKERFIYNIYGIFNDYLIDTNRFSAINGPVYNYENFKAWNKWEIAKIEIDGKPYLILDLKVLRFSYCKYIRQEKRILKDGLNSQEAMEEIRAYSKLLGIEILDQLDYYLNGGPQGFEF
ncbi:hypothetical protein E9840_05820 [Tissierella creatinini]|nr:hypothetical protein E9840_05820 [Tissierella creatinini]TJX60679.1 hypothetical protein E8P77_19795 [Soehngenia saccharolytica]